jgi:hypothetical protein
MEQHMTTGRFSNGLERDPDSPDKQRVGTFACGMARATPRPVGRFSTGIERYPDSPADRRVGSYADGYTRPLTDGIRLHVEPRRRGAANVAA